MHLKCYCTLHCPANAHLECEAIQVFFISSKLRSTSVICKLSARHHNLCPDPLDLLLLHFLSAAGSVSGLVNITANQLRLASPGLFTFNFTAEAIENLNFTLFVDGTQAGDSITLRINTTLPSALDTAAMFQAVMLQRDGQTIRSNSTAAAGAAGVLVVASSWHTMYLPVVRFGGRVFRAHPGLSAQLVLAPMLANITSNATNTTVNSTTPSSNVTTAGQPLTFPAFWSSSNGSFVVPFKLPSNGTYSGQLQLLQSNTSTTPFVSCSAACKEMHCMISLSSGIAVVVENAHGHAASAALYVSFLGVHLLARHPHSLLGAHVSHLTKHNHTTVAAAGNKGGCL
jgi:hypothetical protein